MRQLLVEGYTAEEKKRVQCYVRFVTRLETPSSEPVYVLPPERKMDAVRWARDGLVGQMGAKVTATPKQGSYMPHLIYNEIDTSGAGHALFNLNRKFYVRSETDQKWNPDTRNEHYKPLRAGLKPYLLDSRDPIWIGDDFYLYLPAEGIIRHFRLSANGTHESYRTGIYDARVHYDPVANALVLSTSNRIFSFPLPYKPRPSPDPSLFEPSSSSSSSSSMLDKKETKEVEERPTGVDFWSSTSPLASFLTRSTATASSGSSTSAASSSISTAVVDSSAPSANQMTDEET